MRFLASALALGVISLFAAAQPASAQDGVTGTWEITFTAPQGSTKLNLRLTQDADKVSGSLDSPMGSVGIAGTTTAFAWTFSAFATPQLIGGGRVNMISNLVYQLGFASFNFPFAATLCVAGLALTALVLALLQLAFAPFRKIKVH